MYPPFNMFGQKNQNGMFPFQQFNEFKQNFQGDPKQKVQNLLDTGQMTQEQFNQLSFMAQLFKQFIK